MSVSRGRTWVSIVAAAVVVVVAHPARAADVQPVEPLAPPETLAPALAPPAPTPLLQHARSLHRKLKIATAASLLLTGALGGVLAHNLPNSLDEGACANNDPWFGNYGCGSLGTVHGISAVVSIALYTSTATFELGVPGVPDPEKIENHHDLYWGLTYAHLAGMVAQPLLGLLSRFPDTIGIDSPGNQASFGKVTRTIHEGLGIATIAAYITTLVLEW